MNPVDIGMVAVLALSSVVGVFRGLTREVLGVIGWVGAAILSLLSLPAVRHIARSHIDHPMLADGVTLAVTFIVLLIAFSIISHTLSSYVKDSGLGGLDRALGVGFGFLRGVLILSIVEGGLSLFIGREHYPLPIRQARFTSVLYSVTDVVLSLIPQQTKQALLDMVPQRPPSAPLPPGTHLPETPPQPQKPMGAEQTADALSTLKPQAAKPGEENNKGYNQAQRKDMDRLFQTTE